MSLGQIWGCIDTQTYSGGALDNLVTLTFDPLT